jgi:hypothetical protein
MPEAIMLYEPDAREILIANSELKRLVDIYSNE